MYRSLTNACRISFAAAALAFTLPGAVAAETPPSISKALFDKKHLNNIPAGETITYDFVRNASEPKLLGANFTDKVIMKVKKKEEDGTSDVGVQVFTGERDRGERKLDGLTGNPVLVFFLDRAVANFSALAGGNRAYHKNRFRVAMRTKGGLVPETFEYNGKKVDGYRLAIRPFTGDRKNVEKMKGYENAQFEFLMSDEIPGYFAEFISHYSSPLDGSPSLDETIKIEGLKVLDKKTASSTSHEAK